MYSLVLLAAGCGSRMQLGYNKMIHLINGQPLLLITLNKFLLHPKINEIIIVINPEEKPQIQAFLPASDKIVLVDGGKTRQASVTMGIRYLQAHSANKYVLVHDGARCHISAKLINRCLAEVAKSQLPAYAVGVKEKNTIAQVTKGMITRPLDRDTLYTMQTPQIAEITVLYKCLTTANKQYTDEASLLLAHHYPVKIIPGEYANIKITTVEDLGGIYE